MVYPISTLQDSLFTSEQWTGIFESAYGFKVRRSASGVPYVIADSPGGPRVVALPFSDYLPLSDVSECATLLAELRAQFPAYEILLKTTLPKAIARELPDVEVVREAVLYVMYSDAKPNAKFRSNMRRAERDGVEVREVRDTGGLDRFYDLFARLRASKFNSIPQPKEFFEAVHEVFIENDRGYYLEATYQNSVIGSFVVLEAGKTAYHKFGASSLEKLTVRPNNALFGHLYARLERGDYEAVDLGLTGVSEAYEGLRYFKSTTGARESAITYVRSVPAGYNSSARDAFMDAIRGITQKMLQSDLSVDQLSKMSEGIYPHFA